MTTTTSAFERSTQDSRVARNAANDAVARLEDALAAPTPNRESAWLDRVLGALDGLAGHRRQMLVNLDRAVSYGQRVAREKAQGQASLFGGAAEAQTVTLSVPTASASVATRLAVTTMLSRSIVSSSGSLSAVSWAARVCVVPSGRMGGAGTATAPRSIPTGSAARATPAAAHKRPT